MDTPEENVVIVFLLFFTDICDVKTEISNKMLQNVMLQNIFCKTVGY